MKLMKKKLDAAFFLKNIVYVLLIILVIILSITVDRYLTPRNLLNILNAASPIYLVCIGMSFAMMSGGIDMSVGSIIYCTAGMAYVVMKGSGNVVLAVLAALAVGIACGAFNGLLVATINVYPMLTTMATMYVFKGLGRYLTDGALAKMPDAWKIIGKTKIGSVSVTILIALAIGILLQLLLSYTRFGRHVLAVGDNPRTAREKGINISKIKFFVYTIGGAMCAIAGVIWSSQVMSVPATLGNGRDFDVIIAAVLGGVSFNGGKGSLLPGALVGSIIYQAISNALVMVGASPYIYKVVYSLVILTFILATTLGDRLHRQKK